MSESETPPGAGAVRRADRARRVADVLRQQVLAGGYPTGRLPDEAALVRDFAASRNTIRDALALLAAEGLIERRRGVGTVVVGHRHRHPLDRLTGLAETLAAGADSNSAAGSEGAAEAAGSESAAGAGPDDGAVPEVRTKRLLCTPEPHHSHHSQSAAVAGPDDGAAPEVRTKRLLRTPGPHHPHHPRHPQPQPSHQPRGSRTRRLARTGRPGAVRNEVRLAEITRAPAAVAARLGGATVLHLERLRYLDAEPLSLDVSYLPADLGRPLLTADLAGRDVFGLLEEVSGQPLGTAEVTVSPAVADANSAGLLRVPPGSPLFAIERLTRLADGRPVDLEYLRVRGDRMTLHTVLHR